jgi:hypothetical protein
MNFHAPLPPFPGPALKAMHEHLGRPHPRIASCRSNP